MSGPNDPGPHVDLLPVPPAGRPSVAKRNSGEVGVSPRLTAFLASSAVEGATRSLKRIGLNPLVLLVGRSEKGIVRPGMPQPS